MGKDRDKQADVEDKKKKGADVDVDKEHNKDVSKKTSNADLKKQSHIAADGGSYSAVQAALTHFAKNMHDRGAAIKDWTNMDTSSEAAAGPGIDKIHEIYDHALADAERIEQLLATLDKNVAYTIAPEVKQAQGAAWIFYNQLIAGRNWIHGQPGYANDKIDVDQIMRIVERYTAKIGVDGKLDQNRTAPEGDEETLRRTAVKEEIDALETAVTSVKAGNSADVSRIVIHARYLDNFAKDHGVNIKSAAVVKKLSNMKKALDEIRADNKDANLVEASNHINALLHRHQ